ncbi:tetratricopeptide repeat-containing sulfotransferase family protein [Ruegeria arenilitoris]|uniref:tetratricopeptide repeat-containing sulfotransferase family protein n=1 Tax=Ruegeria arenilitoris TaxID=1173585 RepID=UPI00147FD431|nr:tetratricopeptide repeat-containing sulfotransferase family protein [Ruegeria arenilitoris]
MAQGQTISIQDAFKLAMSHYQKGELKPAATLFSEIVKAAPAHAHAHQMVGLTAFLAGQGDVAVKAMREAVRLQPNDAVFLANFVEILRSAGELDEAVEIGQRAIRLAPGSAAAHSNLGLVYYDQNNLTEAEASQQRALALDPDFDRAINNLGSIARDKGDRAKAAEFYRKALRINPASSETANNLISVLVEDENPSDARAVAEAQMQRTPQDAELHRNFGRVFLLENDLDKAEAAFRNAIAINGQKAESYVGLAQVLFEKNHPKLALIEAENAVRLDPDCAVAFHHVAMAKAHLGDLTGAIASYEKGLELKPDMAASLLALGHLALEQGDADTARAQFEQAAETAEDKLGALLALAKVEKITPDSPTFQQMEAALPTAADMLPQKAAGYHYAMGECYEQLKRYDEAFRQFDTGARLKRSLVDYDAAETDRLTDDLIATFDGKMINRLRGCAVESDRPIFVLGMPRSGTTLTESILDAHGNVFGAGELNDLQNLFSRVDGNPVTVPDTVRALSDDRLNQRAEDYIETLTGHAPAMPRIVDKMPANFQLLGLIHGLFPNAKIIHVARNPFDTCLSCYTRLFERSQLHSYDLVELGRYYNNYVRLMNHWHDTLPEGAFLTVHYEALVDDIEAQTKRLLDYCGLDWDSNCLDFHARKRRVRTASVQQVRQPLYRSSKAKWLNYESQLKPLVETIGDLAIDF